jgi:TfuA-like protein
MEGVGRIFLDYLNGTIEDDDEVAVADSSAEHGYQSFSVAMVNIRATLNAAEAAGVIRASTRMELERTAKDMFYQERSYPAVLQHTAEKNFSRSELESLRRWLPTGQVDQKQEDAIAMLRLMRVQLEAGLAPKCVQYTFEYTANWEIAWRRSGSLLADSLGNMDAILQDSLLDEVRLEDSTYARVKREVLLRFLALRESWRQGMTPTHEMIRNESERFHREAGTEDQESFEYWLQQNHLNHAEFLAFIEDQARLEWVQNMTEMDAAALIADQMRHSGHYARLAKRACDKQRALELAGIRYPSLADSGLTEDELLSWYFEKRLGRPVPSDLARYSRVVGFADENSFCRVILREYCYSITK